MSRTPSLFAAVALSAIVLTGCSAPDKPLQLESRMDGQLNGELKGALKLEGPIMIQMQGRTIRYEGTQISDELLDP